MKRKIKKLIGQAVIYISLYVGSIVFGYLMFLSGTTY